LTDNLEALLEKYRLIAEAFRDEYGFPQWRQHLPPVDELVSTILSQSTSDLNRDKGFDALKARYATWEACRDASLSDLIDCIRPAGLANQKAPRIQDALHTITLDDGTISLDHLTDMPIEEAKAWLTRINGIGPKTAAIILLFAFGRPAFPVDTHVHRVSGRLGLIPPKMSAEKAHEFLEQIVPRDQYYPFHLQMIWHGRQVCHARNPQCGVCVVQQVCDYYASLPPEIKTIKQPRDS
jgi:endonuclease III